MRQAALPRVARVPSLVVAVAFFLCGGRAEAGPFRVSAEVLTGVEYGPVPVRIVVESSLAEPVEGPVTLRFRGTATLFFREQLEVPPRSRAVTIAPVWSRGGSLMVCFEAGERPECADVVGGHFDTDALLIQDELDLIPAARFSHVKTFRVVGREDAGGAFLLPQRAVDYFPLSIVMAELPVLDGLEEPERRALADWVRAGGHLVLFAREFAKSTFLDDLLEKRCARERIWEDEWPQGRSRCLLRDGGTQAVGLGSLYTVTVRAAADSSLGVIRVGGDNVAETYQMDGLSSDDHPLLFRFSTISLADETESSLDASRRPPLSTYLLVVLLSTAGFIIVLHSWARRPKTPLAQLLSGTALVAVASSLVLFGLGAGARGGARYRSASDVRTMTGMTKATMWRATTVLIDEPARAWLPADPDLVAGGDEATWARLTVHQEAGRRWLTIRGLQWQTVSLGEVGVVDLGGAVEVERDDAGEVIAVSNGTAHRIRRATVSLRGCPSVELGDLATGARVAVPRCDRVFALERSFAVAGWIEGDLDLGCPRRGGFEGDRCSAHLEVAVPR